MSKYVYKVKTTGRYRARLYFKETGKLISLGNYETKEEAQFAREMAMAEHHWLGVKPEDTKYGFIYAVVNVRTKQFYIGRKVYKYYNAFTEKRDVDSGWEFYSSSSDTVKAMAEEEPHNLKHTILMNVEDDPAAGYVEHQLIRHYLMAKLPTGEPLLLNRMLPKVFLRGLIDAQKLEPMVQSIIHQGRLYGFVGGHDGDNSKETD